MQAQSRRHRQEEIKMRLPKFLSSFAILLVLCQSTYASDIPYKEVKTFSLKNVFGTKSDWRVTAWQPVGNESDMGEVSARLCFWMQPAEQRKYCTSITSSLPNDGIVYHYQTAQGLEVVHPDAANPSAALLKFGARFFGGGSGSLDQVSFWYYDKKADAFEPSSHITLTEQGEYRLFDKGKLEGKLVTADAVLQVGETHFSPHHFYIEAYRYDAGHYTKILGYLTPTKYPSFEDTNTIDVIMPEIPRIEGLLTQFSQ